MIVHYCYTRSSNDATIFWACYLENLIRLLYTFKKLLFILVFNLFGIKLPKNLCFCKTLKRGIAFKYIFTFIPVVNLLLVRI